MKKKKRKLPMLQDKLFCRGDSYLRPQDYPQRPLSKKNAMLKPIKRS